MSPLPRTTPQKTVPIKSFVVYLADGRIIQISIDGGEGYFREEYFAGPERSFSTHQAFVANGRSWFLPTFGNKNGGEMTTQEPETESEEEETEEEETEKDD
ncbi:MAG: hypothetical protein ABWY25_11790 [Paenisporosarcina sp.]